MHMPA
jgi:transposase InsO family protein